MGVVRPSARLPSRRRLFHKLIQQPLLGHVQPFWSWRTMRRPRDTIVPPEVPQFDALGVDDDDAIACTWLGQSTCFLQLGGARVLLDPVFASQLAPPFGPRRVHPQPAALVDLGRIDLVVCVLLGHVAMRSAPWLHCLTPMTSP